LFDIKRLGGHADAAEAEAVEEAASWMKMKGWQAGSGGSRWRRESDI